MVVERRRPLVGAGRPQPAGSDRTAARDAQRLLRIDVGEPAVRVRHFAVDDVEERALQRLGDRPAAAAARSDLVDRTDRRHLGGRADEEHLVGDVERLARDALSR